LLLLFPKYFTEFLSRLNFQHKVHIKIWFQHRRTFEKCQTHQNLALCGNTSSGFHKNMKNFYSQPIFWVCGTQLLEVFIRSIKLLKGNLRQNTTSRPYSMHNAPKRRRWFSTGWRTEGERRSIFGFTFGFRVAVLLPANTGHVGAHDGINTVAQRKTFTLLW
jgi:hypothetical protein